MAKSLEDVFKLQKKGIMEGTTKGVLIIEGKKYEYSKNLVQCGFLVDLEKIGNNLEIVNLYNSFQIIRKIKITENYVIIDVMDGSTPMRFPKKTPVFFEEWFMDRGSYLIFVPKLKIYGKLATQFDPVIIK